jgi:hypothetical protein
MAQINFNNSRTTAYMNQATKLWWGEIFLTEYRDLGVAIVSAIVAARPLLSLLSVTSRIGWLELTSRSI